MTDFHTRPPTSYDTRPANVGQHLDYAPKPKLAEREVLAAATAIRDLQTLRNYSGHTDQYPGSLHIGAARVPLEPDEVAACIALLIERNTVLLTGLGIVPDQPSA